MCTAFLTDKKLEELLIDSRHHIASCNTSAEIKVALMEIGQD
jgi:hypothetical protein